MLTKRAVRLDNYGGWARCEALSNEADIMTRISASCAAIALALTTASALGADLPARKEPAPTYLPPPPTWTGFYLGVSAGGAWRNNNAIDVISAPLFGPPVNQLAALATASVPVGGAGGFIGGGQIGYNLQFGSAIVAGLEADIQGLAHTGGDRNVVASAIIGAPVITSVSARRNVDYLGTLRGRIGWLFTPSLLAYGTGGLAYGGANAASSITQGSPGIFNAVASASYSDSRTGWTVGGGLEWLFDPNWSAKVEYLYYDLGGVTQSSVLAQVIPLPLSPYAVSQSSARFSGQIVRVGLNFHIDWRAPLIASY
jgi:outer membrane immunogenic protein